MKLILMIVASILVGLAIVGFLTYTHYFAVKVPQQIQSEVSREQEIKQQKIDDVTADASNGADEPKAMVEEKGEPNNEEEEPTNDEGQ